MGDVDDRDVHLLLDLFDEFQDLCLDGHIQRRGGFITDEHFRIAGQGNGDDHSLTHAARKLMGIILHSFFRLWNTYQIQKLNGPFPGFGFGLFMMVDHSFHDLGANGHGGIQGSHGVLEDHGNALSIDSFPHLISGKFQKIFMNHLFPPMIGEMNRTAVHGLIAG